MADIQHFFKGIVFYWRTLYILHLALKMASLFEDDSVDSVTELDKGSMTPRICGTGMGFVPGVKDWEGENGRINRGSWWWLLQREKSQSWRDWDNGGKQKAGSRGKVKHITRNGQLFVTRTTIESELHDDFRVIQVKFEDIYHWCLSRSCGTPFSSVFDLRQLTNRCANWLHDEMVTHESATVTD